MGDSSLSAQTAPNTVLPQPAPDIAGVIKGGTLPEIVVRGLKSADDPIWLPNIGLVFTESQGNRVVRLGADDFSAANDQRPGCIAHARYATAASAEDR